MSLVTSEWGKKEGKIEKIDEIIGNFKKHFKKQLVAHYKSSDEREGEIIDEPIP